MKHKFIDVKEMKVIESLLNKWSGKLTWDLFAVSVARALDKPSISKFTLMSYEPVKQAFNLRKKTLREAKSTVIASMGDVTIDMLIKENEELRQQLRMLKNDFKILETNYADKYRTWAYNLSLMPNVDMSRLNDPLPKIDHD